MDPIFVELLARSPRAVLAMDIAVKATLVLAAAGVVALALRRCLGRGAAPRLVPRPGRRAGAARPVPRPARLVLAQSCRAPWRQSDRSRLGIRRRRPRPAARARLSQSLGDRLRRRRSLGDARSDGRLPSRPTAASPTAPPSVPIPWRILTPSWSWLWAAWLAGARDRPVGPDGRTDRAASVGASGRSRSTTTTGPRCCATSRRGSA